MISMACDNPKDRGNEARQLVNLQIKLQICFIASDAMQRYTLGRRVGPSVEEL